MVKIIAVTQNIPAISTFRDLFYAFPKPAVHTVVLGAIKPPGHPETAQWSTLGLCALLWWFSLFIVVHWRCSLSTSCLWNSPAKVNNCWMTCLWHMIGYVLRLKHCRNYILSITNEVWTLQQLKLGYNFILIHCARERGLTLHPTKDTWWSHWCRAVGPNRRRTIYNERRPFAQAINLGWANLFNRRVNWRKTKTPAHRKISL